MHKSFLVALIGLCGAVSLPLMAQTPEDDAREQQLVEQLRELRDDLQEARTRAEIAAQRIAVREVPTVGQNYSILLNQFSQGRQARIGAVLANADSGALVTEVTPGEPAAEAGLRVGDLIESIDAIDLSEGDDAPLARLVARLGEIESGGVARLGIERGGERLEIEIEPRSAANAPGLFWLNGDGAILSAPAGTGNINIVRTRGGNADVARVLSFASSSWGEMELVPMTPSLGRYFDTEEGLLVVRAPADETIGIEDGDVILAIGGRMPNSPEHAVRILGSFEPGETIEFSLMRGGRRTEVEYLQPDWPAGFQPFQFQYNRFFDPAVPLPGSLPRAPAEPAPGQP